MRDNDGTKPLVVSLLIASSLSACGGSSNSTAETQAAVKPASPATTAPAPSTQPRSEYPPGTHPASRRTVAVITAWADTLRAGHVKDAAKYFDLPAVVQNTGPELHLNTRRAVLDFNRTLPCGAHVVKTLAGKHYTVATFVLTERPGSAGCGATGELAATAFRFRHGKISEWRRVLVPPPLGDAKNLQDGTPAT